MTTFDSLLAAVCTNFNVLPWGVNLVEYKCKLNKIININNLIFPDVILCRVLVCVSAWIIRKFCNVLMIAHCQVEDFLRDDRILDIDGPGVIVTVKEKYI